MHERRNNSHLNFISLSSQGIHQPYLCEGCIKTPQNLSNSFPSIYPHLFARMKKNKQLISIYLIRNVTLAESKFFAGCSSVWLQVFNSDTFITNRKVHLKDTCLEIVKIFIDATGKVAGVCFLERIQRM